MSDYQYILVERNEPIGIVSLNRPKELNALNFSLVSELADALEELDPDQTIRCIVVTGAGEKAFAAGVDIREMSDKSPIDMMVGRFAAWEPIRRIRTPMIAAVGGYALGSGCELAMHCDMIIASEDALWATRNSPRYYSWCGWDPTAGSHTRQVSCDGNRADRRAD
jgi:enoyl-CoA hydratase